VLKPGWSDIWARKSDIAASPVRTSPTTSQSGVMRMASLTPSVIV
jgi:hypothetical protein